MSEELKPCCCGSKNIRPLSPYGVQSIQCRDCHVSLKAEDWNRVMDRHIPEGYKLVPVEMKMDLGFQTVRLLNGVYDLTDVMKVYKAMIEATE